MKFNRLLLFKNLVFLLIFVYFFEHVTMINRLEVMITNESTKFYKKSYEELHQILRRDAVLIISNIDHVYNIFKEIQEHKNLADNELLLIWPVFFKFASKKIKTKNDFIDFTKKNRNKKYFSTCPYACNLKDLIPENDLVFFENIFDFLGNSYFEKMSLQLIKSCNSFISLINTFEIEKNTIALKYNNNGYCKEYKIYFQNIGSYLITEIINKNVSDEFKQFYFDIKKIFENSFVTKNKREWCENYIIAMIDYLFKNEYIKTKANIEILQILFPFQFFKVKTTTEFSQGSVINGGINLMIDKNQDYLIFNIQKFDSISVYAKQIFFTKILN